MVNRYAGEIRINPVPDLRNNDFNNDGIIQNINEVLSETLRFNLAISERITRLRTYLKASTGSREGSFNFSEGGYIAMKGFSDEELLSMKAKGLIDLYDYAADREWVKKYGRHFGLIWENGRAVNISDL